MKVIFETTQGYQFEIESTIQGAENIVAGINFSRANANTTTLNSNGEEITINTTDITSIKFVY